MANLFKALTMVFTLAYSFFFPSDYVHVKIDKGELQGYKATSWTGAKFLSFKGIPYAKPPIGDLRFKAPEEEDSWEGVRDASWHGAICSQKLLVILVGDEDCLYLNVHTPTLEDERLPVMVSIYGGAFVLGASNDQLYGPDYFMKSGIVFVSINYRLGALGFLSTGDDAAPGNAGLKDQVAALRWVKRNIAKFGGDPDNVTIFGESAGGVSVHYHVLSPMSKGLFVKAIAQSGSALNLWAIAEDVPEATVELAKALGSQEKDLNPRKALEFLRTVPAEDIVRMQNFLRAPENTILQVAFRFTPVIEKNVESEEVFLPKSPVEILRSGNWNKVPFITGFNTREGYLFWNEMWNPRYVSGLNVELEHYVPRDITNKDLRQEMVKSIRKLYFDDKPIGNKNFTNVVDFYTDITFVNGMERATKMQVETSDTPLYFYVFSYEGGLNLIRFAFLITTPGVAHADDLGYMYYQRLLFWRKPASDSEDEYVVNTFIRLWTNFAKYGNPTPAGDPLKWEPVNKNHHNYLNISGRSTGMDESPFPERANFWAKAYEKSEALDSE